jgi:hypothetical protein
MSCNSYDLISWTAVDRVVFDGIDGLPFYKLACWHPVKPHSPSDAPLRGAELDRVPASQLIKGQAINSATSG